MQSRAMILDAPPRHARLRRPPAPASAAQAVISDTTSPAPSDAARRRNGASVTPDIGASSTGLGSGMGPTESGRMAT